MWNNAVLELNKDRKLQPLSAATTMVRLPLLKLALSYVLLCAFERRTLNFSF